MLYAMYYQLGNTITYIISGDNYEDTYYYEIDANIDDCKVIVSPFDCDDSPQFRDYIKHLIERATPTRFQVVYE